MAFEKNTVDFLKEYMIRYKKILLGLLTIIGFLMVKNFYNEYVFFVFNKDLENLNNNLLKKNSFKIINKFYEKHSSFIINHKNI